MSAKKILLPVLAVLLFGSGLYYFSAGETSRGKAQAKNLSTKVKKGTFEIYVTATGELVAKNSEKIKGPVGLRNAQIWQVTIMDMVDEGTIVKAGDYVARLDRTEVDTKMKDAQTEIDKIQTQLEQAKIDTAIELRGIRDNVVNLYFSMEDKKLEVEQSIYEPKNTIHRAEIELEKAKRDLKQLKKKYELTQTKSKAKISEILTSLRQQQNKLDQLVKLANQFTIKAPRDGMVIYSRSWNGKIGPGSQINSWDPVVAELPDLSIMISKTYVNEVDISKVQKGQDVVVKVDAFPEREYSGTVVNKANVGEQLKGYDSKVFEVNVLINEMDSVLRPAMTTSNEIKTYTFQNVLHIPLEALFSDSISYVFKKVKGGIVKQEVITGETNEDEVIVENGLNENDEVLLTIPADADEMRLVPLDPTIKEQIKKRLAEEKKKRREEAIKKMNEVKEEYKPPIESNGRQVIIIGG
ncbi:MAG: efflux RND transporter periplasmic adaptor subunit [Saprospiraceae bacterium]